jgi:uncharacterized Zn finger protein
MTEDPTDASPEPTAVHSALLFCEHCGRRTPHRILRWDRRASRPGAAARGIARCRECRLTHPFVSESERAYEVAVVRSDGPVSERSRTSLPSGRTLQVGHRLPGSTERWVILRIDRLDGRSVPSAPTEAIATVWAARDRGKVVPVSIVEGRRTRPARLLTPPDREFEVGGRVSVEGLRLEIAALRAQGRTWHYPGARFAAREVQRIYGRRTASPPAGRSDWRTERERPSSFESSTSRSARSRSSPGVSRKRTVPRARTESGGAAVHRSTPS